MRVDLPLLAAALLAATPVAASACSVDDDYRVPTNLELAAAAETIVLARVVGGQLEEGDPFASTVRILPLAAIKGNMPQGHIALRGMMLARDAGAEYGVLSNPYELTGAHPVSYIGACIRYLFPLGTTALFFLRIDHEGMWAPAGDPFSRWAEDVPDADAPWVQLTRFYVKAAELPEEDRAVLLEAEREALAARADDPVAQLMAADIARQLAGPNQPWNARMRGELGLFDEKQDPAEVESAVEEALKAMREAAEAGL